MKGKLTQPTETEKTYMRKAMEFLSNRSNGQRKGSAVTYQALFGILIPLMTGIGLIVWGFHASAKDDIYKLIDARDAALIAQMKSTETTVSKELKALTESITELNRLHPRVNGAVQEKNR
jgi:hypothetical protein